MGMLQSLPILQEPLGLQWQLMAHLKVIEYKRNQSL